MHAPLPPPRPAPDHVSVGWTRSADARWQRVVLERGTGARITAAVLAVFPGALVHGVVTDVLGTAEVHLVTADGSSLVVHQDRTGSVGVRPGRPPLRV